MSGLLLVAALACAVDRAADPLPPPCRPTPPVGRRRSVAVQLVLDRGVDEAAVTGLLERQVDLAARLGLDLVVADHAAHVALPAAVGGDAATADQLVVDDRTAAAGAGPGRPALARALFEPARRLLEQRVDAAGPAVIDVVVTPDLVAAGSPARAALAGLSALAVSPVLPPSTDRTGGFDLHDVLPSRYRPTIFVSWRAWSLARSAPVDDLLVHELGHALGLEHDDDDDNLMGPRRWSSCVPVLDDAQRVVIFGG